MSLPPAVPCENLLSHLNWRYATKAFDPDKKISDETWAALEQTLVLTPSSYGLQPWRFIVVTNKEVREKLLAHSWRQKQVVDCSHFVVFAAVKKITEADVDAFLHRTVELQGGSIDKLQGYRKVIIGSLFQGGIGQELHEWASRQCYIALGNFMTAAALLQIDTCPMEGFLPAEYDKVLDLGSRGLMSVVCCAAGYRSAADKYANTPKVRFPASAMIERV